MVSGENVEERTKSGNVQRVLVLSPTTRDRVSVRTAGLDRRYDVRFGGPDLDTLARIDAEALIHQLLPEAQAADAIVATKDRSALLAAVLAARCGLPGPSPRAVASMQHKPTARRLQAQTVPEATPQWALLDGEIPAFGPPWFVKPAVGRLSQGARRVDDPADLLAGADDGYAAGWEALARAGGVELDGTGAIVEELLTGTPVTVEGYVHAGRTVVLGVTDSVMYAGTLSFERFEYPSRLPAERLAAAEAVAARLPQAFGFDAGFFNVELFVAGPGHAAADRGQRPDRVAVRAALRRRRRPLQLRRPLRTRSRRRPAWQPEPRGAALSYVVRRFEDAWVEAAPEPADDVEILAEPGANLSAGYANDEDSFRLAIVYAAGETHEQALAQARARTEELRFRLQPPRAA